MIRWALALAFAVAGLASVGGDDPATVRRGGPSARRTTRMLPPPADPPGSAQFDPAVDDTDDPPGPSPATPTIIHSEFSPVLEPVARPVTPGVRRHLLFCVWLE